ncbi:hypothetical protein NIT62_06210 [Mammaliicoccus sciuri]|nr:hypothetical protein NIT62_06210 [Mammaliicoccus sciuri]
MNSISIAKLLGCSSKTIRENIKVINETSKENGFVIFL